LALGGKYAGLFEVQSKYYKEGADENEENESLSNESSRITTDL
jgi:hypothetical protein